MSENFQVEVVDPDPFAVTGLVISAVCMFAQLASLAKQFADPDSRRKLGSPNAIAVEKLGEAVDDAIRHTEKLIKVLAHMDDGKGGTPLAAPFRFGEATATADSDTMRRYVESVQKIGLAAITIGQWAHSLMAASSRSAEVLGSTLLARIDDVQTRINRLLGPNVTYEEVLDECLHLLRQFHSICESIEPQRN